MAVTQVTIAGITGKLGQLTAQHILASSETRVQGFCRDKSKLQSSLTSNPRFSVVEGSSTDLEVLRRACRGSKVVVCTYLGDDSLMVDGQKLLIDAAIVEKVTRFVASDYSIDFTKLQLGQLPSKDAMIHVRHYLQDKPIQGVHIMIGCFTEVFAAYLGLIDVKSNTVKYWGTGDEAWEFTTYGTTAEYIAKVANDEKAVGILKCKGLSRRQIFSHANLVNDSLRRLRFNQWYSKNT